MDARRKHETLDWLGDGEIAELIRTRDWSRTPLGPVERWPGSLRTVLGICLHSTTPVAIYWGRELITLYNDVCAQFNGDKHPHAFGQPARLLYADIWETLGPILTTTFERGVPTSSRNQRLPLEH